MTVGRLILQVTRLSCFCVLLFFFLWTAHVVFYAPLAVARYVMALPDWILRMAGFTAVDSVCLALLSVVVATTFLLARRNGNSFALLKAVQVGSFAMLSLGLIVLELDPSELWVYMTYVQHDAGLVTWFTNGMNLFVSGLIFGMTTYGAETRLPRPAS